MFEGIDVAQATRVFEEVLQGTLAKYGPPAEAGMVACQVPNAQGEVMTVAYYMLYPDGHYVCVNQYGEPIVPT